MTVSTGHIDDGVASRAVSAEMKIHRLSVLVKFQSRGTTGIPMQRPESLVEGRLKLGSGLADKQQSSSYIAALHQRGDIRKAVDISGAGKRDIYAIALRRQSEPVLQQCGSRGGDIVS